MGCVQGRGYGFSPERFESMKLDNGYIKGQRRQQQQQNKRDMSRIREQEGNGRNNGVEVEKRIISRDQKEMIKGRDGIGNGNRNGVGVRIGNELSNRGTRKMEGDELVDGWPKWLVDNIPKEVLVGLVPKTADSYDKLAKVSFNSYVFNL